MPARSSVSGRGGEGGVERVLARAGGDQLAVHRKLHAEVGGAEAGDLGIAARLLAGEVVGREAEHHQALVAVLLVELLQPFVLLGEAALGGHVDHQQHLAGVLGEGGGRAVDLVHGDGLQGVGHVVPRLGWISVLRLW
jgi:hypothetical protein